MERWAVCLLLLLWTITIKAEDTIGMYSTPEGPVPVGSKVTLSCWALADPMPSYMKMYSTKPGYLPTSNMLIPYDHDGQKKVRVEYVIQQVMQNHTDKYTCQVSWEGNKRQRATFNLTTFKPIFFTTQPPSPVSPGGRVIFYCYTDPHPEDMYLYKEEQQILHKSREHLNNMTRDRYSKPRTYFNFPIDSVSDDDAGNYTCLASYLEGVPNRTMMYRLDINKPPSGAVVTETLLTIPRGEPLSLTCSVSDPGFPAADILWYKVGHPDILVRQHASYEVDYVTSGDRGVYYCVARNQWGISKPSQNVSVIVIWPPSGTSVPDPPNFISIGQSFNMTCNLQEWGYPVGKVFWYKATTPNTPIEGGIQGRLVISNVSNVDQAGPYFCVGTNDYGSTKPSQEITIPVKSPLTVETRSPKDLTLHPLFNKESFILNITVSGTDIGEPQLIYGASEEPIGLQIRDYITKTDVQGHFAYGQKSGRMYSIKFNVKQGLSCDTVTYMDGKYWFVARKREGWGTWQDRKEVVFNLALHYPAIWKDGPGDIPAVIGDRNITITHEICANPKPSLRWTLDKHAVPDDVFIDQSGGSITIPEVKAHHVGVYACTASNVIDGREYTRTFEVRFLTNETLLSLPHGEGGTGGVPIYVYIAVAVFVGFLLFGLIGFAVLRYKKSKDSNPYEMATNDMVQVFPPNDYVNSPASVDRRAQKQNGYVNVNIETTPNQSAPQVTIGAVSRPTSSALMMVDGILSEVNDYVNVNINSTPHTSAPLHMAEASTIPQGEVTDWCANRRDIEESDDDYVDIDDDILPVPSSTRTSVVAAGPSVELRTEVNELTDLYAKPIKKNSVKNSPVATAAGSSAGPSAPPNDLTDLYAKPMKRKSSVKNSPVATASGSSAGPSAPPNDLTDLYAKPMKRKSSVKNQAIVEGASANPETVPNDLTDLYAKPIKKKPSVKEPGVDSAAGEPIQEEPDKQDMLYAKPTIKRQPTFKIVDDGVLYSEMSFKVPDTHDPTVAPYIHGAEDRVDYASIDWDKTDKGRRSAGDTQC